MRRSYRILAQNTAQDAVSPWMKPRTPPDAIKLASVLVALAVPFHWYLLRINSVNGPAGMVAYVSLWLLSVAAILSAAFCPRTVPRVIYAVLLTISAFVVDSYQSIMGEFLTYDAFVTIYQARAFLGDAVGQFRLQAAQPALTCALLFVGILLPPRSSLWKARPLQHVSLVLPAATVMLLTAVAYGRGGAGVKGLPSSMVTLPYQSIQVIEAMRFALFEKVEREHVALHRDSSVIPYDVVILVDESVRADYLEGRFPYGTRTDVIKPNDAVHNFGFAAAATNCSAGTNVILRHGGTRELYASYLYAKPTIWEYAKAAGLKTVYIDAQRTRGGLQNQMYQDEVDLIDSFIQFDDTPLVDRDIAIADTLSALTRNEQSEFIMVNKLGAHFPVHDKYPDEYMTFTPTVPRGTFANVSDTGKREGFGTWDLYLNAYRNTLLWNVGHFFDIVFERADLSKAVIFYTSDHGQDFHEGGSPGYATHCQGTPSPNEGLVPQLVITTNDEWAETAHSWARKNHDATSHFNIFPTLLAVMGYAPTEVRQAYGPSLFEPTNDPLTFVAKFNRFSRAPVWTEVRIPESVAETKVRSSPSSSPIVAGETRPYPPTQRP